MAAKRLAGPAAVSNAAATKYTVGAGLAAVIRHIHVQNPSGSTVTFTLSIGADAAGVRLFDGYSIAPGAILDWFCYLPMAAAEIIQAFSGTNNVLTLEISGDENVAG